MSLLAVQGGATGTGTVTILAPSTNTNQTLTLPDATGTVVSTASTAVVTPAMLTQPFTSGTAVASTSGTSIDFTSIPSWVKRITIPLSSISTNGTSPYIIQIGDSGGVEITSYLGSATRTVNGSSADVSNFTSGFILTPIIASSASYTGTATLVLHNASTNLWNFASVGALTGNAAGFSSSGIKTLSATLDRIRLTTENGTDTFDAGSVNILYEG